MPEKHSFNVGGSVSHRYVADLLEDRSLEATVHTHRDAELALADVPTEAVLGVRPTGFASAMSLAQGPLTVIELDSLPTEVRERVTAVSEIDLDDYEMLTVGRTTGRATNRSLAEF